MNRRTTTMSDRARARWCSVIHYRTETGTVDVEHLLAELADLHDVVELGPHWDTIEKIEISRVNHNTAADLTVEQAGEL
jgi:hypothetical protein